MAERKKTTKRNTAASRARAAEARRLAAEKKAQEEERRRWILVVLLTLLTLVAYLRAGVVGTALNNAQRFFFGKFYFIVMGVITAQVIIIIINGKAGNTSSRNPLAIIVASAAFLLLCSYLDTPQDMRGWEIWTSYTEDLSQYFTNTPEEIGGGLFGALLLSLSTFLVGRAGTILVIFALTVITALLVVNLDVYKQAFATIREYFTVPDEEDDDEEEEEDGEERPSLLSRIAAMLPFTIEEEDEDEDEEEEEGPVPLPPQSKQSSFLKQIAEMNNDGPGIVQRSPYNITADDAEPETEDYVPVKKPAEDPKKTIFMSIDDLVDRRDRPAENRPAVREREPDPPVPEPEPVYIPPAPPAPAVPQPRPQPGPPAPAADAEPVKMRNRPYRLPSISLLDPVPPRLKDDPNLADAEEKGELLIQVLRNFDIESRLIDTHIGPAVTKFEIRPDPNVKVSKIIGLTDNVKMQLAVRDIRIEAPIPGHNAVGVEVPNVQPIPVKMKELIQKIPEKERSQNLLFILGKDLLGNVVTCRLDRMPHLLIAGATGSGKSVCMNSIITSFLLRTKPDEVKMLLIDPKKVEFTPYQRIPHLIGPVINDPNKANNALKVIVRIMDERYDIFSRCGVRNIQVYNEKVKDGSINAGNTPAQPDFPFMPYIVVIIDELADLMAVAGKEVEGSIQRITQLARAAGIHLIVATQRPSTDVITGIIKANIPSRIAFSVSSGIDSRTILDHVGAERLLGNGDMLYMPIGQSAATRVQGVFVTDEEVHRISEFVSSMAAPVYDDAFVLLEGIDGMDSFGSGGSAEELDPLFNEVKDYVIEAQKASTSLLQRRFGIGYNRAARMIDLLEQNGVIGPQQGSKPREVFIKKEEA